MGREQGRIEQLSAAGVSNANWRANYARCIWDTFRSLDFMGLQGDWLGAGKGMV